MNCAGNTRVQLASALIGAVSAQRVGRARLADRNFSAIAIDRGRRGIDDGDLSMPPPACLIENIDRPREIDPMRASPLLVGTGNRRDRRQMKTTVDVIESRFDGGRIGDVGMQEFYVLRQVLTATAREIIEHPHPVASLQQHIDKMRAHEPGTAGHEKASHLIPLRVGNRAGALTNLGLFLTRSETPTVFRRVFRGAAAGESKTTNDRAFLPFFARRHA
jgi:hypothetical protein